MISEFKKFLTSSNALALAIGVIIGGATGKVVSSVVDDMLMPLVGLLMPGGDWREAQFVLAQSTDAAGKITVSAIKYGHFIGALLDFVIISFIVFLISKSLLPKEAPVPSPEATKKCRHCLETIPEAATKCRACTSSV